MDYWTISNELLDYWNGLLDYWNGPLDYCTHTNCHKLPHSVQDKANCAAYFTKIAPYNLLW